MKIEFFWDVTLRRLANNNISENANILFQWKVVQKDYYQTVKEKKLQFLEEYVNKSGHRMMFHKN
jgi:hypothetical protein